MMCKVMAEAHLDYSRGVGTDGFEPEPEEMEEAIQALCPGFDPYMETAKGTKMTSDYHHFSA